MKDRTFINARSNNICLSHFVIILTLFLLFMGNSVIAQYKVPEGEKQLIEDELIKFEEFVKIASENGATHVVITNDIPHAFWQFDTEGDPYPAWYAQNPSLFKIFPPDRLKSYVNIGYAEKIAAIFEARCKILRRYGLNAFYFTTEPALLPEKFFTDHPELRGPRVDHPNRSKVARFAPCVDHPEILAMYREAMKILMKRCPEITIFNLFTSDSGSGFCWNHGLYAGRNGNSNCEHRPMAERVIGFMTTLQEAAREVGTEIELNIQPIHPRQWMPATFTDPEHIAAQLPKGLTLAIYKNVAGESFNRGMPGWGGDAFYPVVGLTNPVGTARSLTRSFGQPSGDQEVYDEYLNLTTLDNTEETRLIVSPDDPEIRNLTLPLYKRLHKEKPQNQADMMRVLRKHAIELAGEEGADDLLEIWLSLDWIANDLLVLNFGPTLYMGPILARWINRPLVPFPEELNPEEITYYRKFLFQAKGEEQAHNLIDIQAMRMFEGYGAKMLVQRVYEMVMAHLTKAQNLANGLLQNETNDFRKQEWQKLANRLGVLQSLVQTVDNVIAYQAFLDLARSRGVKPEENPVLGTATSWDRQEIRRIARNEIDNAARLKRLLESSPEPLIHTAPIPEYETIRILGPQLPQQLKYKIDIMNKHWLDYNRIYTPPNP
jgi:hypothetical protein